MPALRDGGQPAPLAPSLAGEELAAVLREGRHVQGLQGGFRAQQQEGGAWLLLNVIDGILQVRNVQVALYVQIYIYRPGSVVGDGRPVRGGRVHHHHAALLEPHVAAQLVVGIPAVPVGAAEVVPGTIRCTENNVIIITGEKTKTD